MADESSSDASSPSDSATAGGGATESDGSWGEGLLHTAEGALEETSHFIETTAEEGAKAFEAAGASAEDAAKLVESDADMIPGVSEVASAAEVGWHAGAAVGSAVSGDWDGAADHALSMSESAANFASFGVAGLAEGAFDLGGAAAGGGEGSDAHHEILGGLKAAGDWLGDEAYNLVHGDDASSAAGGGGSSSGGDPGAASGGDAGSTVDDASAYQDASAYADGAGG